MYAKGEGIRQNDRRAVDLFRMACDLGEPIGCANVAVFGERMRGTLRVWPEIRHYYGLACEGGFDPACQRLNEIAGQP